MSGSRLDRVRSLLGPSPRELTPELRQAFALPRRREWRGHPIAPVWHQAEERLRDGEPVAGHLLPLSSGAYVVVVTTFDRALERAPSRLAHVAWAVTELWRQTRPRPVDPRGPKPPPAPRDPDLAEFAEAIHRPGFVPHRLAVPRALTGGPLVELSQSVLAAGHGEEQASSVVALALRRPGGTVGIVPPSVWAGRPAR